jgi:hypothetical protein
VRHGHGPARTIQTGIGAVEFESVAVGTFEVISDDLVLLDQRGVPLEPVGEPLVQLGARLLRERVVGGVADQQMPETEGVVAGQRPGARTDELLADEPEEWGGTTQFADVSAKQKLNLDDLLERVLLVADAELDLRANANAEASGPIIESRLDVGRGPAAPEAVPVLL